MRVKGSMMLEYVKLVRANKERPWDRYLEPGDWEVINSRILPSNWYPYEVFVRIGYAVFKEIAQGNLETVRLFGRYAAKNVLKLYRNILIPGDPVGSVERLARLRRTFFEDGSETRVIGRGDKFLDYLLTVPPEDKDKEYVLAFSYQVAGNLEEIIEQAGGKKLQTRIEKTGEGYKIAVRWE